MKFGGSQIVVRIALVSSGGHQGGKELDQIGARALRYISRVLTCSIMTQFELSYSTKGKSWFK